MATQAPPKFWLELQLDMVRGKLVQAQSALDDALELVREGREMEPHWCGDLTRFYGPVSAQVEELEKRLVELADADTSRTTNTRFRDLIDAVEELLDLVEVAAPPAARRWSEGANDAR